MIRNLISISPIFLFKALLVTNLLISRILFSTSPSYVFKALLVTKFSNAKSLGKILLYFDSLTYHQL